MGDVNLMTTAEQLKYIRKVVMWTLWRIATTDPEQGPTDADPEFQKGLPERLYDEVQKNAITGHAESLFCDDAWVAKAVGDFAANQATHESRASIDWAAFSASEKLGLKREQLR